MNSQSPRQLEIQKVTTVDGKTLVFSGEFFLPAFANYGHAPVSYVQQRGYRQIGQTVRDFTLDSRTLNLQIFTVTNLSRDDYWRERARIIDVFRPNRGVNRLNKLTLTLALQNGERYKIEAFYAGGLEFQDDNESENSFSFSVGVRLFCPNPIWYAAQGTSIAGIDTGAAGLQFPITFPITFGSAGETLGTGTLNYNGTWRAYPTITLDGPYSTAIITLLPSNTQITLVNPIVTGEQRIITLSESGFTITDGAGADKFLDISSGNFVDFYLRPTDQLAAGATQQINTQFLDAVDGVTAVTYQFNEAYIGV